MLLSRTGLLRVVMRLMMDRRVPIRAKVAVPLALVYLISPIDFVPDFIPFQGWVDDIIAITLATAYALHLDTLYRINYQWQISAPVQH